MPTVFRKCKVCGVEYPYCKTVVKDGVFRYQDVACCPEHGSIYLQKVIESRDLDTTVSESEDIKESAESVSENIEGIFTDASDLIVNDNSWDYDDDEDDDDEEDDDEEDIDI